VETRPTKVFSNSIVVVRLICIHKAYLEREKDVKGKIIRRPPRIPYLSKKTEMRKTLYAVVAVRDRRRQRIRYIPRLYDPPPLAPLDREQEEGKEHGRKHDAETGGDGYERGEGGFVEGVE
jgi:hypothetical protein